LFDVPALVIDTSSAAVSAAVVDVAGGTGELATIEVRAARVTLNARGHGELLAPSIQACLAEAGIRAAELSAVVAGTGPGPFTGLRVGLVTAAVLADTLAVPAYGVCSLDGIGRACAGEAELLVATDARRHEVYWARYRYGVRIGEPQVSRPADIDLDGYTAAAGAGARSSDIGAGYGGAGLARCDVDYPPASALAALAAARILAGAAGEVLTPLYLRRPDAVANMASKPVSQ
jgi:tRNA threonylcarbamoyl adenosine modification protein YeaZ